MSERDPENDAENDAELDPVHEQRVRDLLAGLGSSGSDDEPLPPDVALRLDDTLAGLVAEREAAKISEEHNATGKVVPLRPRWMPRIAAAAAAVIVLGLGGLTAVNLAGSGGGDSAKSSDAGAGTAGLAPTPLEGTGGSKSELAPRSAPDLSVAGFARDVRGLLVHTPALRVPGDVRSLDSGTSAEVPAPTAPPATCPGPAVTDGSSRSLVSLDGRSAALVVHPPRKGKRLVEAWSCDGTHRLASTTVAP